MLMNTKFSKFRAIATLVYKMIILVDLYSYIFHITHVLIKLESWWMLLKIFARNIHYTYVLYGISQITT
jgi:hypothetical protein